METRDSIPVQISSIISHPEDAKMVRLDL